MISLQPSARDVHVSVPLAPAVRTPAITRSPRWADLLRDRPTLRHIIADAARARHQRRRDNGGWQDYETFKRRVARLRLEPAEHDLAIRRVCVELGV